MIDLKCKGAAIGVVSVDQMSPVIADSLSAQLVRAASLRRRIGGNHAGHDPVRRSGERSYQSAQERAAYKRASASRPSGQWNDEDYDVLADGTAVGRIFKANAAPVGSPWLWTLAFGHHQDCFPTHGHAETRKAAMAAFAKSWRREWLASNVAAAEGDPALGQKRT
jgi:hypothetical protein